MRTHGISHCNPWRVLRQEDDGQELLEMAFVLPLLMMLLLGIFWLGRGYNTYQTMTHAAREGARLAVAHSCATCGNTFASDAEIRTVVDNALAASALDPAGVIDYQILRDQVLNIGSIPTTTGVVISFRYPFQIFLPFTSVGLSSFTISTQVQMREEN